MKKLIFGIIGTFGMLSCANALPSVDEADLCALYPNKYVRITYNGTNKCIPINPCASEKYRDMYCVEVPVVVFTGADYRGVDIFFKKYIQTHYHTNILNNKQHYAGIKPHNVLGYRLADGRYVAFEFKRVTTDPWRIYRKQDPDGSPGTMCWAWKDCDNWNATKCSKYADFRSEVTAIFCSGEMSMDNECLVTCEGMND